MRVAGRKMRYFVDADGCPRLDVIPVSVSEILQSLFNPTPEQAAVQQQVQDRVLRRAHEMTFGETPDPDPNKVVSLRCIEEIS